MARGFTDADVLRPRVDEFPARETDGDRETEVAHRRDSNRGRTDLVADEATRTKEGRRFSRFTTRHDTTRHDAVSSRLAHGSLLTVFTRSFQLEGCRDTARTAATRD